MVRIKFLVILMIFISCSSTNKINIDTNQFNTSKTLSKEEIIIRNNLKLNEFQNILYVKPTLFSGVTLSNDEYFINMFKEINYFKNVYSKEQFQNFLENENIHIEVIDNISLNNIARKNINFLYCEIKIDKYGLDKYNLTIKIINPSNLETIYEVEKKYHNWLLTEKPLVNPIFNDIIKWIKENK